MSLVWVSRDIYKTNRPVSSFTAGQLQIFTITGIGKPSSIGACFLNEARAPKGPKKSEGPRWRTDQSEA